MNSDGDELDELDYQQEESSGNYDSGNEELSRVQCLECKKEAVFLTDKEYDTLKKVGWKAYFVAKEL